MAIRLPFCNNNYQTDWWHQQQFQTKKESHNRLAKMFIALLNEFYTNDNQRQYGTPSVQFFADKLSVTPNYLGDVVRNITGISPIEHIHQNIIREAKRLLKQGMYSNSEIAYHLGFEYPNYFSRLFKKVTGLTPTEYKEQ